MCHAGLDQKYVIAEMEARAKAVAFRGQKKEEPGQPKRGVLAVLSALVAGWMRKGLSHV